MYFFSFYRGIKNRSAEIRMLQEQIGVMRAQILCMMRRKVSDGIGRF
jgi:hypothetical protein